MVTMVKVCIRSAKGFSRPLLSGALLAVIAQSPASAYELIDLGANVVPKAINNAGVVVGASNTDPYSATAFRWTPDSGFELIDGTEVDFIKNGLNEAFSFRNPNVTGECGCGESFNI